MDEMEIELELLQTIDDHPAEPEAQEQAGEEDREIPKAQEQAGEEDQEIPEDLTPPPALESRTPQALQSATIIAEVRPRPPQATEQAPAARGPRPPDAGQVQQQGIRQQLAASLGRYVIGEFLAGERQLLRREGVLVQVGEDYLLLQEEASGTQLLCPLAHLQFLTTLPPDQRPQEQPRQPQSRASALYPPLPVQSQGPGQAPQAPRRGPWR